MCDEEWVKLAMADDSLVVELLLRLHQTRPPPPPPPKEAGASPYLHQLHWTVRQRRSRSVPRHGATAEKKGQPTRASPTTPLSWSGATSASGGAGAVDGYEESSRPTKQAERSRSKVANPSETAVVKRLRRKKTLAELKEEENLLLKERGNLKNELASLRLTVEKHRATNESLKRMKLDLESRKTSETATTTEGSGRAVSDPPQHVEAQCHPSNPVSLNTVTHKVLDDESPVSAANASSKEEEIGNQEASFLLPDLNLPVDEDLSSSAIHGIS